MNTKNKMKPNQKFDKVITDFKGTLQKFCFSLMDNGLTSAEVAQKLGLKPGAVRAWKAWASPSLAAKRKV